MELNEEKFLLVKELAEIDTKISEGKAILDGIESKKEVYFKKREKEALQRVNKTLEMSADALKQANSYKTELDAFRHNLSQFLNFLLDLESKLDEKNKDFEKKEKETLKQLDEKNIELEKIVQSINIDKEMLKAEMESIKRKEYTLNDREKQLNSQESRLKSVFNKIYGER